MATSETEEVRLDFGNLPLVEAAVRASFESPTQLTFKILNDIAKRLESDFSTLEEPRHIEVAPGISPLEDVPLFLPGSISGAVYAGNQLGLRISVQNRVIVVRWLHSPGRESRTYPRYDALRNALWMAVEAFRAACGQGSQAIIAVNMSYVNFVRVAHASPVLRSYFSDSVQVGLVSGAQEVQKLEAAWREHDNTDLRFNLEAILRQADDEKAEGYRLETAGGRLLAQSDDEREVLDCIHRRMQEFFRGLLSDAAKNEWHLREVPRG